MPHSVKMLMESKMTEAHRGYSYLVWLGKRQSLQKKGDASHHAASNTTNLWLSPFMPHHAPASPVGHGLIRRRFDSPSQKHAPSLNNPNQRSMSGCHVAIWLAWLCWILAEKVEVPEAHVPCVFPFCSFRCFDGILGQPNRTVFAPNITRVELESLPGTYMYPIGFAIPEEMLVPCLPEKYWPLALSDGRRIHANKEYQFQFYQEQEYRRQYRHAYFGITRKKFGYDCLRHYEIIANGAIPLFLSLGDLPERALPFLPRDFLHKAWGLLGNRSLQALQAKPAKSFKLRHGEMINYYTLLADLMSYARRHLTTKAMAIYVLETVRAVSGRKVETELCPKRILFLSGRIYPDYQRDMLLHGLKKLCPLVVDFPRVDHMYGPNPRIRPDPVHGNWQKSRGDLHSRGFTYSMTLDFDLGRVDRSDVRSKILEHYYEMVIFGSIYRNPAYFQEVQSVYTPSEIVFIDGEDLHLRSPNELAQSGVLFRRELVLGEKVW